MDQKNLNEAEKKVMDILMEEWPNELKAHRIVEDVIKKIADKISSDYERLYFIDGANIQ